MSTSDIEMLLAAKYPRGKYVKIWEAPEINIGGGRCDLVAVGVWGSTGNKIIGHEVKATRSDWQKELQSPEKSERFSRYCHRWYIVAAHGIVKLEELQPHWGLMEVTKNGGALKIRRQAKLNESPQQIGVNMMGAWLRRVSEGASEAELSKARREGRAEAEANAATNHELLRIKRDLERSHRAISKFEAASGVKINAYDAGRIGEAVKSILNSGMSDPVARMENMASSLERLSEQANAALAALRSARG